MPSRDLNLVNWSKITIATVYYIGRYKFGSSVQDWQFGTGLPYVYICKEEILADFS